MSAPVNDRRTELVTADIGGGSPQVTYTYDFPIQTVDDIKVYAIPVATGIPVEITTRSATTPPASGSFYVHPTIASILEVTINTNDVVVGDSVVLEGDRSVAVLTSFSTTGDFDAADVNAEYENLRRLAEENARDIDRSLSRNPGHTGAFDMELPATLPIGHAIIIDSAGTGLSTLDVASENAAIVANTTHRGSDGKDHSDVVTNTAGIATNVTNIATNTADIASHSGSDGTSHTYIDQDVTTSGTPTFASVTTTGDGTFSGNVVAGSSTGAPTEASADNLIVGSVITSNNGLSILSINTSNICFSDAADADVGRIRYTHGATNSMEFRVAAQAALTLNSGLDATFADDVEVGGNILISTNGNGVKHSLTGTSNANLDIDFSNSELNNSIIRLFNGTPAGGTGNHRLVIYEPGTSTEKHRLDAVTGDATFAGDVEVGGNVEVDQVDNPTGHLTLSTSNTDSSVWLQANGTGAVYINRYGGSGGAKFGDGSSGGVVATITSSGDLELDGGVEVGGALTVETGGENQLWEAWLGSGRELYVGPANIPTLSTVSYASNRRVSQVFELSGSGSDIGRLYGSLALPYSYQSSPIIFDFYWTQNGTGAGDVKFTMQTFADESGDAMNVTNSGGNTIATTTAPAVAGQLMVSTSSSIVPHDNTYPVGVDITGNANRIIHFAMFRNAGDASDTLTDSIYLIGIRVRFA